MKKFEERLGRLEELAEKMRDQNLPLEEAVAVFEEGIKLAKSLERDFDRIQGKVEMLLKEPGSPDEKPELGLFDAPE